MFCTTRTLSPVLGKFQLEKPLTKTTYNVTIRNHKWIVTGTNVGSVHEKTDVEGLRAPCKMSKLRIRVDIAKGANVIEPFDPHWISEYLELLVSDIVDRHCLKSLHVELNLPESLSFEDYEKYLCPLLRLRNIDKFTMMDCAPDRIVRKIRESVRSTERDH